MTRELVTDLPVQLAASGFLADALHVRPGEIIGAGEFPERLGAPIVRADPAVAVRVLPGVARRPGCAVLRSPFAPLFEEKRHASVAALVAQGPGPGRMHRPGAGAAFMGQPKYQNDGDPRTSGPGFAITMHPGALTIPLHWRAPRLVFVNSMSDLFWRGNDLDLVISAAQSICTTFSTSATHVADGRWHITSAVRRSASPGTGLAAGEL